jgi:hypothetical protein
VEVKVSLRITDWVRTKLLVMELRSIAQLLEADGDYEHGMLIRKALHRFLEVDQAPNAKPGNCDDHAR